MQTFLRNQFSFAKLADLTADFRYQLSNSLKFQDNPGLKTFLNISFFPVL